MRTSTWPCAGFGREMRSILNGDPMLLNTAARMMCLLVMVTPFRFA
jgi:hypothetical protein